MNSLDYSRQNDYFYSMLEENEKEKLHYLSTVPQLLEFSRREYGNFPALSDGKRSVTYDELYMRVGARRGYLLSLGLKKGDRIAILSPNTMNAMETYLAVVTLGMVSVILPCGLDFAKISAFCKKFDVSAIMYDEVFEATVKDLQIPKYSTEFRITDSSPAADVLPDDICSICLTGGTTGIPKGAIMTHRAIMRGAFNGCFVSGGVLHNSYIVLLPLSHIFGLVKSFLSVLYTGGLCYECRDVKTGIMMIPTLKPTTLVLVPGMADIIADLSIHRQKDFSSSVKTMIIGAAPVTPKLQKKLRSLGITVFAGYGLTEAANLTSGNKNLEEKPDSMGMIYPGQEVKIVDGELRLKGDNVMLGYFGDEKATKEAFDEDGWLRTGDLVSFDEDGCIYITGRIKSLIILSNGENVSPEELEELFYKYSDVKDCLVSEMKVGERAVIGIEIIPESNLLTRMSDEELDSHFKSIANEINKTLPEFKRISKVVIRKKDFKRTGAMKISRNKED